MARHFNHRRKLIACSSQEPLAYNESLQYPSIAVLLLNSDSFFFRPLSSVHLFQSNQRLQAIELVDRHVLEKL